MAILDDIPDFSGMTRDELLYEAQRGWIKRKNVERVLSVAMGCIAGECEKCPFGDGREDMHRFDGKHWTCENLVRLARRYGVVVS